MPPSKLLRIDRSSLTVSLCSPDGINIDTTRRAPLARFSLEELRTLYRNTTGWDYAGNSYNALVQATQAVLDKVRRDLYGE